MADLYITTPLFSMMAWTGEDPGLWLRRGREGGGINVKSGRPLFSERSGLETPVARLGRFRVFRMDPLPDKPRAYPATTWARIEALGAWGQAGRRRPGAPWFAAGKVARG